MLKFKDCTPEKVHFTVGIIFHITTLKVDDNNGCHLFPDCVLWAVHASSLYSSPQARLTQVMQLAQGHIACGRAQT